MNKPYIICYMITSVDGRATFPPVFNRAGGSHTAPTFLQLVEAKAYNSGAVFIRYKTK